MPIRRRGQAASGPVLSLFQPQLIIKSYNGLRLIPLLRRRARAGHGHYRDISLLRQPGEFTDDLFAATQPVACDRLMSVMDGINQRYGKGTLRSANVPRSPEWGMRRELLSQSFTTRLDQLWRVYCR
nr:DUF4113 domain-containing protein [Pseudomonas putida]